MSRDRFQRLKELFDAVCELPPSDRAPFLDQHCGDDRELYNELRRLLEEDERLSAPIDAPALGGPIDLRVLAASNELPEQIGPYQIHGLIGEGGMGTVYEAEQQHPRRSVALKVIRTGLGTTPFWRRFEREIDVLGRLQHPGIAQIYEAGIAEVRMRSGTVLGRCPYYTMELVRGKTLIDYATERALSIRERLELFTKVGEAVHYAHEKSVVHRDLKPANILVAEEGTETRRHGGTKQNESALRASPKILDFGIARVTESDLQVTTLQTEIGQLLGTLAYMSPEQVAGDSTQIDARSDVYSLGVILYELLTGRLPYDVSRSSIPDAIRRIREDDPTRLSAIDAVFRGDIETVVAKALDKDPSHRYQSAGALVADIHRYLADEPIVARPASTWYQFRKFAKRNRGLVGGTVTTVLALAIGLAAAVHWARQEHRQRVTAERETYRAKIAAAGAALRERDVVAAERFLEQAPPHLRNWEWRYYQSQLDDSLRVIDASNDGLSNLWISDDGRQLLSANAKGTSGRSLDTGRSAESEEHWQPTGAMILTKGPHVPWKIGSLSREKVTITNLFDSAAREISLNEFPLDDSYTMLSSLIVDSGFNPLAVPAGKEDEFFLCLKTACRHIEIPLLQSQPPKQPWLLMAVSSRGRFLLERCRDDMEATVQVRDLQSGEFLYRLDKHTDYVQGGVFSPDESHLASVSRDGTIRLWESASGEELAVGRGHTDFVDVVSFSPDGRLIATGGADRTVRAWDAVKLEPFGTLVGHRANVTWVGFSPRSSPGEPDLVSADGQGTIRTWDLGTATRARQVLCGHTSYVYPIQFSPDGTMIASGGWDGTVRLWDLRTGQTIRVFSTELICTDLFFTPDGTKLITQANERDWTRQTVTVWDVATGKSLHSRSDDCACTGMECLGVHADGRHICVEAPVGNTFRLWDTLTGERVDQPVKALASIRGQGVNADGTVAVRWEKTPDGQRRDYVMFDVQSGRTLLAPSDSREGYFLWYVFSRDGRKAIAPGPKNRAFVYLSLTGESIGELSGHTAEIMHAAFSPDGTRIATCGRDKTIRLWDGETYEEITQLIGHTAYVRSVAFSPDGSMLASGSGDHTVRIWDTRSLRERRNIAGSEGAVHGFQEHKSAPRRGGLAAAHDPSIP